MDILVFAQTTFYLTFSLAVVILAAFLIALGYYIVRFVRCLQKISENLENASGEIRDNIIEMFDRFSEMPILSMFVKKHRSEKGRKKVNGNEKK